MTRVRHLNCGFLQSDGNPKVGCHCLLLEDQNGLVLVDTGIGLLDCQNPLDRIGQQLIDLAGFQFNPADTAIEQIRALGLSPAEVTHIVLTHADPDHTGGLADFPNAVVHLSQEEHANLSQGSWRYLPTHFSHDPNWQLHSRSDEKWFGLEARPLKLGIDASVLLIPLFGHTHGHCGVAVEQGNGSWLLFAGDAYYLRVELATDDHPVSRIAAQRAEDDSQRRDSLEQLRRLVNEHPEVEIFGYHDLSELPS